MTAAATGLRLDCVWAELGDSVAAEHEYVIGSLVSCNLAEPERIFITYLHASSGVTVCVTGDEDRVQQSEGRLDWHGGSSSCETVAVDVCC